MTARIRPGRIGVIALLLLTNSPEQTPAAPAEGSVKPAATQPTDADTLRSQAESAEKQLQWEKALELYLRSYLAGRQTPDVRDKIKNCLRHASQARRQRDPGFQQFVLNLPPADALNLYAEVVAKLQSKYADRLQTEPERLFALGLEELDRALADKSFRAKQFPGVTEAKVGQFRRSLAADWKTRLPKTAREARQAVFAVTSAAQEALGLRNPSSVVFEFVCGACTGLDEYTVYLSPNQSQSEIASPTLELAAYGVLIAFQPDAVVVEGIVPDSWAAAVQLPLRPGDRLVRVNGRLLQPATPVALAEAFRAPTDGGHDLEFASGMGMTPVRLPTPAPTVIRAEMLAVKDGIGYIRVGGLRASTAAELDEAILRLRDRGMRALILDLRGNPGGLFSAGVQVAQRFIPSGIIATTQGQAAEFANRVFSSDSGMAALDIPLVLLIDTKTMSSAEIVAGALKDHNRATVIGMPTFGKGAVQHPFSLRGADDPDDMGTARHRSGVLIVTIARAFSPRGTPIHGVGVTPHVVESDPQRQLSLAIDRAVEMIGGR